MAEQVRLTEQEERILMELGRLSLAAAEQAAVLGDVLQTAITTARLDGAYLAIMRLNGLDPSAYNRTFHPTDGMSIVPVDAG
jgi:hypothetical protein